VKQTSQPLIAVRPFEEIKERLEYSRKVGDLFGIMLAMLQLQVLADENAKGKED